MNHEPIEELLAAYSLGVLDEREQKSLEEHMQSGCDDCRLQLVRMRTASSLLAYSLPLKAPAATLKKKVFAELEGQKQKPQIGMNRRGNRFAPHFRARFMIAGLVFALVLFGLYQMWVHLNGRDAIVISSQFGAVLINGAPSKANAALHIGDTLTTGPAAQVEIHFGEQGLARLGENAELKLVQNRRIYALELNQGSLLSVLKSGTDYRVKSLSTVASVRGTIFFMRTYPDRHSTYVCACKGTLFMTISGVDRELVANNHKALIIEESEFEIHLVDAALFHHTDAQIKDLEKRFY